MAKPILVMRVNEAYSDSFSKIQKLMRKHLNDEYHVLAVGSSEEIEGPVFEVFNVDKEEPITYAKLKKLINKEIESVNT